ncbi:aminodeoxychorismate lyase [Vibrio methylphosphonaticus]|uniref:aminodeoxychorismate lyase n=1 Tax=Vibrio methylphosphonaticus TaxID=2946866 RepID=UPI00202A460C|nr:aminodeoxychorismate lyase [Vibrio methylphosphonaticus]MCL9774310.1 aminodeoxychorismate lyase [Vibrio methylphosphonaticus]
MFWRDGEIIEKVSVSDRSFQYGDGCFTTILTKHGNISLWQQHVARMNTALKVLQIPQPNWSVVYEQLTSVALMAPLAGLKIHVSRGCGGRGYSPSVESGPITTISCFPYPAHYLSWRKEGLSLMLCQTRLGLNPLLAGIKHNNRLEQVLMKAEIEKTRFDDGLALDLNDNVIETSMANVFWVSENKVYTPTLFNSGVAGVMRAAIIEALNHLQIECYEGEYTLSALLAADEIFVSNCILGVAPVKEIEEAALPIGKVTRRIQEYLGQC